MLRGECHLPDGGDPRGQVCPGHEPGLGQDPAVGVDDAADAGCRGADVFPYQPSLVMVTRKSALLLANRRTKPGPIRRISSMIPADRQQVRWIGPSLS